MDGRHKCSTIAIYIGCSVVAADAGMKLILKC